MNCLNILTSMSSKVFLQFFRAQKFQEWVSAHGVRNKSKRYYHDNWIVQRNREVREGAWKKGFILSSWTSKIAQTPEFDFGGKSHFYVNCMHFALWQVRVS
jgi:hypothetical protein